jgi:nucleoside-diphosphate-sugar epimerase
MKPRIAVLGATGVYGRHLLPRLVDVYDVQALVRRPEQACSARACGARVVQADIFDERSLQAGLGSCEIAINLATSLPRPGSQGGDYARNDELRREGTRIWVRACRAAGVSRIVQQSIAMTHAGGGDAWADESTFHPADESSIAGAAIAAVRAMEDVITDSDLDWLILRGGLFYGPGTGFDEDWFTRARAGKLRLPGDGADYVSLVHIADMASASAAALRQWPSQQSLIVADDRPATWREVFEYVCTLANSAAPDAGGRMLMPSFRVRNERARAALSWSPAYPDFRAGLAR